MKKKQIVCTYNNEISKDYKQYTLYNIINDNFVTNYSVKNE